MMTAYSPHNLLAKAIGAGALGVLEKPFCPEKMIDLLNEVKPEGMILLASDDESVPTILVPSLEKEGYRVIFGAQATADLNNVSEADVLVLGPQMPFIDSLEIYLKLKTQHQIIPTILLSEVAEEGIEARPLPNLFKIIGCLVKPFDPTQLLALIRSSTEEKHE